MKYYCEECGSVVKKKTGKCPACNHISKIPKKRKSKLPLIIILSVIGVSLIVGIVITLIMINQGSDLENKFERDVEVFESGDMDKINSLILQQPEIPEDMIPFLPENSNEGEGLVADLIAMSEIEFGDYSDDTINVIVTAPDMSGCAEIVISAALSDDEDELKKTINDYAEQADKITTEVTLDYVEKDGEILINYNNEEFLNAVTGNFSVAYSSIYAQYIEELVEEVEVID